MYVYVLQENESPPAGWKRTRSVGVFGRTLNEMFDSLEENGITRGEMAKTQYNPNEGGYIFWYHPDAHGEILIAIINTRF